MKSILGAVMLTLTMAAAASAQQTSALVAGRTVDRTLAAGETHRYTMSLEAGRFVSGRAVQHGIDVRLGVVGPAGDTLNSFDSPNGTQGPEPFQFTTTTRGTYQVIVRPLTADAGSGRYTLTLERNVAAATTPAGKVDQLMAGVGASDPGLAVAVMRDGRVIYQKAWGLANLTHKIPFTVNTLNNIGSTSKQFTAFAILMLAQQNKLSLDDDVRKHVPELPDLGQVVTIRHLLTHTSGYREFLNSLVLAGRRIDYGDYIERREIIEMLQRQPALQNAPGAEFNYNNSGYSLLSTIVERVSGTPFPEFMQTHVFKPLGMTNSVVRATAGQVIPNSSQGYVAAAGTHREAQDIGASMGAGGIYTTIADLAKWIRNYKTGAVGPPGFFQQMTTRNIMTKGDTSMYALGLMVDTWRGLRRVHHGGADVAHRSSLVYFPELDAGITVQSNNGSTNVDAYTSQIAEAFFSDRLQPAAARPLAGGAPAAIDSSTFDVYAGSYALDAAREFVLSFTRRGARYFSQATGQPEVELQPTSDSTFRVAGINASVTFHREPDGSVKKISLHQNGVHTATRIGAAAGTRPALAPYAGRYFSDELEAFFDVVVEKDTLMLRSRRGDPVKLQHTSGESFSGSFPVATITFERDAAGNVTGFRAGNARTRDVLFKRID